MDTHWKKISVHFVPEHFTGKISLYVIHRRKTKEGDEFQEYITVDTKTDSLKAVGYETGDSIEPLVNMTLDEAQELIDRLRTCGLRPTEGKDSTGSLAATEKHLDDMRKIVSKRLGINL